MNIKKCVPPLLIILIFCFAGCTTKYNSLTNVKNGNMELIAASKAEVLSAAYNAISSEFPSTYINEINGYQSGFSWHHQPLLDATNFKLLVKKMTGITKDGTEVEGNSISVVTSGTQGLVESRYVAPLISKFENILLERGIKKVTIEKVTLSDDSNNNSNFDNQPIGTGTGFFISEEGDLITNYHVIKNATNISGILSDGKTIPLNIVLKDEINDIALLKANIKSKGLKILSSDAVIKGKEVFALGYPLVGIQGQEQKATFGRINALSGLKGDIRYFQIDVPIQPGNSGGPLIDKNGNVVGLVTAMLSQLNTLRATGALPQNVNYAIKSDYIIPLLIAKEIKQNNINPNNQTIGFDELIKIAENSVVLIIAK